MFPSITSSASPSIPSLAQSSADKRDIASIVNDIVHLYYNKEELLTIAKKTQMSRQQLSAYISTIKESLSRSDDDDSDGPSPLCIKRHAWQAIDPKWALKPRNLNLYDEKELNDIMYDLVIQKTRSQVAVVNSHGIGKRSLGRKVDDVKKQLEKDHGIDFLSQTITPTLKAKFKSSISLSLKKKKSTKGDATKITDTLPSLTVHTPFAKKNIFKTKVGILSNISPAVVLSLSATSIASPEEVTSMLTRQTDMKGVKIAKDASKLTPGGTATCKVGVLQQRCNVAMENKNLKNAEAQEKNAKKKADKQAADDAREEQIENFLQSISYVNGTWVNKKRTELDEIAKLFRINISNFNKTLLTDEIKLKIISKNTLISTVEEEPDTHEEDDRELDNTNVSDTDSDNDAMHCSI